MFQSENAGRVTLVSPSCNAFKSAIIASVVLISPLLAQATGLNASHFSLTDDLTSYGDAEFAASNTLYTPDLDLSSNEDGLNLLQNKSLDEVFVKFAF